MNYEELKISKNHQIPDNYRPRGEWYPQKSYKVKYPFSKMKIGDSVLSENIVSIKKAAKEFKKGKLCGDDWNYCIRKEGSGVRLWRVS